MIHLTIEIWEGINEAMNGESDGFCPKLVTYCLEGAKKRPAVLICPGGGYSSTSEREAEPIALQFNAAGYHAFVLYYSIAPRRHPQPLLDVSRAMTIIRHNAHKWNIDNKKVLVCGFSAGGHLAASLGVHWEKEFMNVTGISIGQNRPDGMILAYPVITSGKFANRGSFNNLLGADADPVLLHEMSLEYHVSHTTPPAFIWHTFEDGAVPVENCMLFSGAMREAGIPFELHIFPKGGHGLSLATVETGNNHLGINPHVGKWVELCNEWIGVMFE